MEPFEWLAPQDLPQALEALQDPDSLPVGGGQALLLLLRQSLIAPRRLVWLSPVGELAGIRPAEDGGLVIGASVTVAELARSPEVQRRYPSLGRAAAGVGNPRVRAAATVGGSLAHADPCQDLPPVLITLGASLRVDGAIGPRRLPLDGSFFVDFMTTALAPGEIVTALELPPPSTFQRSGYIKFTPRSHEDYATVGVAASLRRDAAGRIAALSLALAGVGPTVVVPDLGDVTSLPRAELIARAGEAAVAAADPWDDQRGTADYKRAMARVFARRLVEELAR